MSARRSINVITPLAVIIVIFVAVVLTDRVRAASDAGEFLISFGKRAVKELNDESLSKFEQEGRFRELFIEAVDLPAICRFILGRYWRAATEQERYDFLLMFEDMAVERILPMFTHQTDEYQGKDFDIVEIRPVNNDQTLVLVRTLVVRKQGAPASLTWRIRERDGRFQILDLSIEGISMVLTLRQEYSSVIRETGGVSGLIDLMREKLKFDAYSPEGNDEDQ
jgi:phospholipid transport system substrate-binding protein